MLLQQSLAMTQPYSTKFMRSTCPCGFKTQIQNLNFGLLFSIRILFVSWMALLGGVVSTPSRERLLDLAASRLDVIRNYGTMNRHTTHIVVGVPGCGKKFFLKLLVAALTIFLEPKRVTHYWASFRARLPPLTFDIDSRDALVFGFEDMSHLQRMNCEHSKALWNYMKGCMKRGGTLGFFVESLQTLPDIFFQSRVGFSPLNNTVVGYLVYEPLLTTAEYSNFFQVLGLERPTFATLELLQFWTGQAFTTV